MSISKAQRMQFLNGYLQSLGSEYKTDPIVGKAIELLLFQYAEEWNKEAKLNLTKSKAIASGALYDVSVPIVRQTETGFVVEFGYPINSKAAKYYDYVNKGVKGIDNKRSNSGKYKFNTIYPNRAMAASIFSWLNKARKSIRSIQQPTTPIEKKRTRLKKMLTDAENKRRLAYAISTKIKRDGLRATYYIDKAMKSVFNADFRTAISDALDTEITIQIRAINGSSNKRSTGSI
jgi:hypothetical protein